MLTPQNPSPPSPDDFRATPHRTSVVLVGHEHLLNAAFVALFTGCPDIEFTGTLTDDEFVLEKLRSSSAQVALIDANLPTPDPFYLAKEICKQNSITKPVLLMRTVAQINVHRALQSGVAGIALLTDAKEEFISGLHKISLGENWFSKSKEISKYLSLQNEKQGNGKNAVPFSGPGFGSDSSEKEVCLSVLTTRQLEVLRYLALGYSVKDVAKLMHLSEKSIDSHKYRIMGRLGIHDRVLLARYAIREGLVEA